MRSGPLLQSLCLHFAGASSYVRGESLSGVISNIRRIISLSVDEASVSIDQADPRQDEGEEAASLMTCEWGSCCDCCRPRRSWREGLIVVLASLVGAWVLFR